MKSNRGLGPSNVYATLTFQNNAIMITFILAALRLWEILSYDVFLLKE